MYIKLNVFYKSNKYSDFKNWRLSNIVHLFYSTNPSLKQLGSARNFIFIKNFKVLSLTINSLKKQC